MGTRSLTYLWEDKAEKPFLCMYRQFDGYKEGHGKELAEFLAPITMINGIGGQKAGEAANGMGCLAAQLVTHFKGPHGIGGFYLHAPDLPQDAGQEYEYHVAPNRVTVYEIHFEAPNDCIFVGTWKAFAEWAGAEVVAAKVAVEDERTLPELFKAGETVHVRFRKADGTIRDMRCTKNFDRIPEDMHPGASGRIGRNDPHLFKVYDLDKQDWRSFRDNTVISFGVAS
jgi:hypothetical protein